MQVTNRGSTSRSIRSATGADTSGIQYQMLTRVMCIAGFVSALAACGAGEESSSEAELVVTQDARAMHHWVAPSGRMEMPMEIDAGTIVLGQHRDPNSNGTCTVRWTDMEKREALGGDEPNKLFLDLPCSNLAIATDADRSKRVPYERMVPSASPPDQEPIEMPLPENLDEVALSAPVWACSSEKEYRENLGNADADCVVVFGSSRVNFIDPMADAGSKFYRIRLNVDGKNGTYYVHKHDFLPIQYFPSRPPKERSCATTPQATCVGDG